MSQQSTPTDRLPNVTPPAPADQGRRPAPRAALWLALAALLAAAAALLGQFGELGAGLLGIGRIADADAIQVDANAFKDYFAVAKKHLAGGGRHLMLTLKRAKAFPLNDTDFENLAERTAKTLPALLALEALARGYVRCEYFGEKGKFLGFTWERIRGLTEREAMELPLPVAGRRGLARIVLTF